MRTIKKIIILFLLVMVGGLKGQTSTCIPTPTVIWASCTNTCSGTVIFDLPAYSCYSPAISSYSVVLIQSPFLPIIDTLVMTPGQYTINNVCINTGYAYELILINSNASGYPGNLFYDEVAFGVPQSVVHNISGGNFHNISCFSACDGSMTLNYFSESSSISFTMIPPTGPPVITSTSTPYFSFLYGGAYTPTVGIVLSYTNLCAGTYTIIGMNDRSCTTTFTQTITQRVGYTNPNLTIQNSQSEYCVGEPITFNFTGTVVPAGGTSSPFDPLYINMGECQSYNLCPYNCTGTKTIIYTYNTPGVYNVMVTDPSCPESLSLTVNVVDCSEIPQDLGLPQCMSSFKPSPGDYILSFWVKEALSSLASVNTFSSGIKVNINGPVSSVINVYANSISNTSNRIIDGWQKVEQKITIPASATDVSISLMNNTSSGVDVYFDDIRFHPFNASFKSYVYDPVSLRLSAELDERNYATFYEYDEEGQLIRVKKETERGIQTIKESRISVVK